MVLIYQCQVGNTNLFSIGRQRHELLVTQAFQEAEENNAPTPSKIPQGQVLQVKDVDLDLIQRK